jgi:hypothetical protein
VDSFDPDDEFPFVAPVDEAPTKTFRHVEVPVDDALALLDRITH